MGAGAAAGPVGGGGVLGPAARHAPLPPVCWQHFTETAFRYSIGRFHTSLPRPPPPRPAPAPPLPLPRLPPPLPSPSPCPAAPPLPARPPRPAARVQARADPGLDLGRPRRRGRAGGGRLLAGASWMAEYGDPDGPDWAYLEVPPAPTLPPPRPRHRGPCRLPCRPAQPTTPPNPPQHSQHPPGTLPGARRGSAAAHLALPPDPGGGGGGRGTAGGAGDDVDAGRPSAPRPRPQDGPAPAGGRRRRARGGAHLLLREHGGRARRGGGQQAAGAAGCDHVLLPLPDDCQGPLTSKGGDFV